MREVTIHGYTFSYSTLIRWQSGLQALAAPNMVSMGAGYIGAGISLKPNSQIAFEASGRLQASSGVGPIKIGFVQTVISSVGWASYDDGKFYTRKINPPSCKDGEGKPWYREDSDHLFSLEDQQAKYLGRLSTHFLNVKIKATDRPSFTFPTAYQERSPTQAYCLVDFITCLMLRTRRTNYYLHQYDWQFLAHWVPQEQVGEVNFAAICGYVNLSERPLPPPYTTKPPAIILDGRSANRSEVEALSDNL